MVIFSSAENNSGMLAKFPIIENREQRTITFISPSIRIMLFPTSIQRGAKADG